MRADESRDGELPASDPDAGGADRADEAARPELFSSPRMPAVSPWRILAIGALGVIAMFVVQFSMPERTRVLLPVALWVTAASAAVLAFAHRVWRRTRLRSGGFGVALQLIHARWEDAGILAPEAATWEDIYRFEHEYGVRLPADLRRYFLTLNGTKVGENGGDDELRVGFWHIDQLRPFVELQSPENLDTDSVVAFADCSFGFYTYGVRLSVDSESTTQVVVYGPYGRFVVAETFSQFLTRYAFGDWSVLFPEFSVVADEEGIGGEVEGAVSYVVRWADVRQIEVEVVVPRWEPGDPVAGWVVRGEQDAAPFTAPVDTVAGGHIVRRKIRSLPGFDERAFQAARDAEARHERGTFVVWRAQTPNS